MDIEFAYVVSTVATELVVAASLALILFRTEYSLGRLKQVVFFKLIVGGLIVAALFVAAKTTLDYWGLSHRWVVERIVLAGLYLPWTFVSMNWLNLVATTLEFKWEDRKWWKILTATPFVVLTLVLLSPFADTLIDVSYAAVETAPTAEWFIAVVNCAYFAVGLGVLAKCFDKMANRAKRRLVLILFGCAIFMVAGEALVSIAPRSALYELVELPCVLLVYTEMLASQTFTDALTGLANRRRIDSYLESVVEQASEENPVELFIIGIDFFKSINDTLGHQAGDVALQVFSDALRAALSSPGVLLGRMGGDEFIVVSENGKGDPAAFIERLGAELKRLSEERHLGYDMVISYGFARCVGRGMTVGDVLKRADEDMYGMKSEHHATGCPEFMKQIEAAKAV